MPSGISRISTTALLAEDSYEFGNMNAPYILVASRGIPYITPVWIQLVGHLAQTGRFCR